MTIRRPKKKLHFCPVEENQEKAHWIVAPNTAVQEEGERRISETQKKKGIFR